MIRTRLAVIVAAFMIVATGVSARVAAQGAFIPRLPPWLLGPPLPPPIMREFRAVWISPVGGGGRSDWPSAPGLSAEAQQAELRALLDRARAIGLNTVIFHVRPAADAMYSTGYAPWSAFLTGTSGGNPGYDPLAYAIQEAHARGLQLHAWFNPFRATLPNFAGREAREHVVRTHPEWIRHYGTQTWIDPGDPNARRFILATMLDVVQRYDIDGIHLDDYFYPYRETETITKKVKRKHVKITREIAFPDDVTWKRYGVRAGWTDRGDWRRNNVNDLIKNLYQQVKQVKPWVLVGISPFGIWRSGTPPGVTGLDAYNEIYADSRRWLAEGWLDYFVPQLYWPLDGAQSRFTTLDAWWRMQNPLGREIWPGLYSSMVRPAACCVAGWAPNEISNEIADIRKTRFGSTDDPGHVHFRMAGLLADGGALGDSLQKTVYAEPALVPAAPWLAGDSPAAPFVTTAGITYPYRLKATAGDSIPVLWWLVQEHRTNGQWVTTLHRAPTGPFEFTVEDSTIDVVAVRPIGRSGLDGPAMVMSYRKENVVPRMIAAAQMASERALKLKSWTIMGGTITGGSGHSL